MINYLHRKTPGEGYTVNMLYKSFGKSLSAPHIKDDNGVESVIYMWHYNECENWKSIVSECLDPDNRYFLCDDDSGLPNMLEQGKIYRGEPGRYGPLLLFINDRECNFQISRFTEITLESR